MEELASEAVCEALRLRSTLLGRSASNYYRDAWFGIFTCG